MMSFSLDRFSRGTRVISGVLCFAMIASTSVATYSMGRQDGRILLRLRGSVGDVITDKTITRISAGGRRIGGTDDKVFEQVVTQRIVATDGHSFTFETKVNGKCETFAGGSIGCTLPYRISTVVDELGAVIRSEAEGTSPTPVSVAWLPVEPVDIGSRWTTISPARRFNPIPDENTFVVVGLETVANRECVVISATCRPLYDRLGMHRSIGVGKATIWFDWRLGRVMRTRAVSSRIRFDADQEASLRRNGLSEYSYEIERVIKP